MKTVAVNMNAWVRVRPNEIGVRTLLENHRMEQGKNAPALVVATDDDGYLRVRLWELMNQFGACMGAGLKLPFENPILVEINE